MSFRSTTTKNRSKNIITYLLYKYPYFLAWQYFMTALSNTFQRGGFLCLVI
ncbi:hypothetical protein GCWU000246_00355 [Jonquetella anthropi E3_33 E1]|nr:hypothetical protein GCWU000246_00355 [Jonquetella anthropi E3_33 E1]